MFIRTIVNISASSLSGKFPACFEVSEKTLFDFAVNFLRAKLIVMSLSAVIFELAESFLVIFSDCLIIKF